MEKLRTSMKEKGMIESRIMECLGAWKIRAQYLIEAWDILPSKIITLAEYFVIYDISKLHGAENLEG